MSKHTQGPWTANPAIGTDNMDCGFHVTGAGNEYRGSVAYISDAEHIGGITIAERNANAMLIAAAPETAAERDRLKAVNADLLSALKTMVVAYGFDSDQEIMLAKAAIAKAEGAVA